MIQDSFFNANEHVSSMKIPITDFECIYKVKFLCIIYVVQWMYTAYMYVLLVLYLFFFSKNDTGSRVIN